MIIDISIQIGKMKFDDALKATKYGDTIIYHVGEYAGGKHKHEALAAAGGGLVALVQKRLGKNKFQYLAQRSNKKLGR
tara:strand:+ start:1174 stop:1407 length:234 start_codon:yes stop_codon:yes gene_type:complete